MKQVMFDFRKILIVPNHWGPVYHLQYDDHRTAFYDEQPDGFFSIDEAFSFAEQRGIVALVPELTRQAYSSWPPEQLAQYRAQCRA